MRGLLRELELLVRGSLVFVARDWARSGTSEPTPNASKTFPGGPRPPSRESIMHRQWRLAVQPPRWPAPFTV